jgi:hypothetical protein
MKSLQDVTEAILATRINWRGADPDIKPIWTKMTEFEQKWYVLFKRAYNTGDMRAIKLLAEYAGIVDPVEMKSKINNRQYLFRTDLINVAKATYWEYVRQHSEHKEMKKAKRKRKIKHNPDTCQRELDWDASYWFSDGVIDLAEMRGRTNYEDYSQKPGWWPV